MKSEYFKAVPIDPNDLPNENVFAFSDETKLIHFGKIEIGSRGGGFVYHVSVATNTIIEVTHYLQPVESNQSIDEAKKELRKIRNYFGTNDKTPFEHWAYKYLDDIITDKIEIIRNACAMTEGKLPTDEEILKDAENYANKIDKENGRVTTPTWNLIYSAYADGQKDLLKCKSQIGNDAILISPEELRHLRELAHQGLPAECINKEDEVKFCEIRQGDGNKCQQCSHYNN